MALPTHVIVGAGLAGAKAAEELRGKGFDGRIVLVGTEPHPPYERPPLSKDYLSGNSERQRVFVHHENWYAEHEVELWLDRAATRLDRAGHRVELADGTHLDYDKLLLTTGSSPRVLPEADDVHYLRTLDDADQVKGLLATASRLVVIGAGWIGLEVTAAARQAGLDVIVLEALELPLLRVLGREVAQVFADLHRSNGVDLRFGVQATEIDATSVRLADGTLVAADAVLIGAGATPNTDLAEAAGLDIDNGIVVDASLRTNDPDIFAAGDVANAFHPLLHRHIRVEHWANALNQPAVAAAGMLGQDASYDRLPYFYTDQYDLGMEYVGHVDPYGYDRVVFRGDGKEFIAFWLSDNRVLAGMNVNVWDVGDPINALIRSRMPVDPDRLGDPSVPLTELAAP